MVVPNAGELQSPPLPQLNFDGVLENLRDRLISGLPRASSPLPMPRSSSFLAISLLSHHRSLPDDPADANQTAVPSAATPSAITISTDDEDAAPLHVARCRPSPLEGGRRLAAPWPLSAETSPRGGYLRVGQVLVAQMALIHSLGLPWASEQATV